MLKARAWRDGWTTSDITSGSYEIIINPCPGTTERVSAALDGSQITNGASSPAASADGRYVAFVSSSSDLVPGDTNGKSDIFVKDRETGEVTRVSIATDGTQADGDSCLYSGPSISADGRYVAFDSIASNLIPGKSSNSMQVYVYDQQTGRLAWASTPPSDAGLKWSCEQADISADGRYVVFLEKGTSVGKAYIHDMATETTEQISVSSDGTPGNSYDYRPSVSGDGRYVAFASNSTNLVPNDTNWIIDVFVRDRLQGTTARINVAQNGEQAYDRCLGGPSISANGRFVVFSCAAKNLVPGDTNGVADVFVKDMQTGALERVSIATDGTQANAHCILPCISENGRFVAFESEASTLVPGDTNGGSDVFVRDRLTGQTQRISVSSSGAQGTNGLFQSLVNSYSACMSESGYYVFFASDCDNLIAGDTNQATDIFVRERENLITSSWNQDLGGPVRSAPSLYGNRAYIGSEDGKLYCQETGSGTTLWSYNCRAQQLSGDTSALSISTRPAVYAETGGQGRVYASTTNGYVFCLSTDGALQWRTRVSTGETTAPAPTSGSVYLASLGKVYRLNAQSGAILGSSDSIGTGIGGDLSIPGTNLVWYGSDNGTLYCLSEDLSVIRTFIKTGDNPIKSSPFVMKPTGQESGGLYIGSGNKDFRCIDAVRMSPIWGPVSLGSTVECSPWYDWPSRKVVFGCNDGKLYAFSADTGAAAGSFLAGAALKASPVVLDGIAYIGCEDNILYAVKLDGMTLYWKKPLEGTPGSLAISSDSNHHSLIVGCSNGKVYCFPLD